MPVPWNLIFLGRDRISLIEFCKICIGQTTRQFNYAVLVSRSMSAWRWPTSASEFILPFGLGGSEATVATNDCQSETSLTQNLQYYMRRCGRLPTLTEPRIADV